MDQIKDNDIEFEQRHLEVLNFVKEDNQDTVDQEEAIFNEHVNRVAELIERLEEFEFPEKMPSTSTTAPDSSSKLSKRLQYIEQQKEATATSMHSPPVGMVAHPKLWPQKCQKDLTR